MNNHDQDIESFVSQYFQAKKMIEDPIVLQTFRLLQGSDNKLFDQLERDAEQHVKQISEFAKTISDRLQKRSETNKVRVYMDGCFDLLHSGHYNAIRQAKNMGDHLSVGVNKDSEIHKLKGPTILNQAERCEILRHCKFIDEVIPETPYTPTVDLVKKLNCDFYAHGDDPAINIEGQDITIELRA